MAGYAEAGAELPTPFNIPFKIWLQLPDIARRIVVLLLLYPVVAFLSVVTIFQILPGWINIEPVQRYALRGLGIDKQNLIDTSGVIDTVNLVRFESDVAEEFSSIFIKRGQVVGLVAQLHPAGSVRQHPACIQPVKDEPSEGAELGTFEVSVVGSKFKKTVPLQYTSEMQVSALIIDREWIEDDHLDNFDSNDDLRVNVRYKPGDIYLIPAEAKTITDIPESTAARANPYLACEKYKVLANIRIAKPELLLKR